MALGGGGDTYVLEGQVRASGVDAFTSKMAGAGSAVDSFKTKVGAAGAGLAALSAGGLAKAVSAASDFEQQMVELEKVTTPQTAREMGSAIQDMASEMPLAQSELAGIAEQAGRLGISGTDNIQNFTRVTGEMATATDLSADQAADAFARMATLMNEPIENVRSIGDATNELSNTMATSSSEITDAATRSSGALTNMGASSSDILALNAAMNEVSPSARVAGTQLRRMAQELMNPAKVADLAEALGMTAGEFKSMRQNDPTELIKMMAQRMGEGGQAADALRGTLSTTSRQALAGLSNNLDSLNSGLETSKQQFEEGGSLAAEFETAMGTFKNTLQITENNIRNLAISTGGVLLPALTKMMQAVNSGISAFSRLNEASGGLAGAVTLVSGLITGLTAAFYGLAGTGVAATLATIGTAVGALAAPLAATAGAVTALAVAWQNNFGGIADQTKRVADFASSSIGRIANAIERRLTRTLTEAASQFGMFSGAAEASVATVVEAVASRLIFAIQRMESVIMSVLVSARRAWVAHGDQVVSTIQSAYTSMQPRVAAAMSAIRGAVSSGLAAVRALMESFSSLVGNIWAGTWGDALTSTRDFASTFTSVIQTGLSDAETALRAHSGQVRQIIESAYQALLPVVQTAVGAVTTAVRTALGAAESVWARHGETVRLTLSQAYQTAATTAGAALGILRETVDTVLGFIKSAWQTLRPVVMGAIRPIVDAVTNLGQRFGLLNQDMQPTERLLVAVASAFLSLTGPVGAAAGAIVSLSQKWGSNVFGIRDKTRQALGAIRQEFGYLSQTVVPEVRSTAQSIHREFTTGLNQAQMAVSQGLTDIQQETATGVGRIEQAWQQHAPRLREILNQAWQGATAAVSAAASHLTQLIDQTVAGIEGTWREHGSALQQIVRDSYSTLSVVIGSAVTVAQHSIREATTAMISLWRTHGGETTAELRQTFSIVQQVIGGAMDTLVPLVRIALDKIAQFWRVWGDEIETVAHLTSTVLIGTLKTAVDTLVTTFRIGLNTINGVVTAGLQLLRGNWRGAIDTLVQTVRENFGLAGDLFKRTLDGIVQFTRQWGSTITELFRNYLNQVFGFWQGLYRDLIGGSLIPEMLAAITNAFRQFGTTLIGWITGFTPRITQQFRQMYTSVLTATQTSLQQVLGAARQFGTQLVGWVTSLRPRVVQQFRQMYAFVVDTTRTSLQNVIAAARQFGSQFIGWLTQYRTNFVSRVRQMYTTVLGVYRQMFAAVLTTAQSFGSNLLSWLSGLVSSFVGGVQSWMQSTAQITQRGFMNILSAAQSFGSNLLSWLSNTANAYISTTQSWMQSTAQITQRGFMNILSAAQSFGSNLLSWLSSTVNAFIGTWNNWLSSSAQAITQTFSNIGSFVDRWASSFLNMISRLVSNAWDAWREFLKTTAQGVEQTFSNIAQFIAEFGRNFVSEIQSTAQGVTRIIDNMSRRVTRSIGRMLSQATRAASGWVSGFVKPFERAKDRVVSEFEELKNKVSGNSIVPDMLNQTLSQTSSWSGDFAGAYSSTADDVASEFGNMEDAASAPMPGLDGGFEIGFGGGGRDANTGDVVNATFGVRDEIANQTGVLADVIGAQPAKTIDEMVEESGEFSGEVFQDIVKGIDPGKLSDLADELAGKSTKHGYYGRQSKETVLDELRAFQRGEYDDVVYGDTQNAIYNIAASSGHDALQEAYRSSVGLADGGIISSPVRATVGEAGPEAVAPLDELPGLMAAAAPDMGGRGGDVNIDVKVDASGADDPDAVGEAVGQGIFDEVDAYLR